MTAKVILNPYSNRWRSKERWPEAEAALLAAGVDFDLSVSQQKGQETIVFCPFLSDTIKAKRGIRGKNTYQFLVS